MIKKRDSVITGLSILYIAITLINISVFNLLIWENQSKQILKNASLFGEIKGTGLKHIMNKHLKNEESISAFALENLQREVAHIGVEDFQIIDNTGQSLYKKHAGSSMHSERRVSYLKEAIQTKSFINRIFMCNINLELKTLDLFVPFMYDKGKKGIAMTTLPIDAIDEQLNSLYKQCLLVSIIIILLHIVFAGIVAKFVINPIQQFLPAIQEVSNGNFQARVDFSGTDEIGLLASSFNDMCLEITRMQDEAKDSNPLSGLPGNIRISQVINKYIAEENEFAVLYCDLDNFKAYNDLYGFSKGDEVILYCRDQFLKAAQSEEVYNIFVGHEGGDDFVVILPFECCETYVEIFIASFDAGIAAFYNQEDALRGYIHSVNRRGVKEFFPLIGVSIAGVNSKYNRFNHFGEVVHAAVDLKKYVKAQPGSAYKMCERVLVKSEVLC